MLIMLNVLFLLLMIDSDTFDIVYTLIEWGIFEKEIFYYIWHIITEEQTSVTCDINVVTGVGGL